MIKHIQPGLDMVHTKCGVMGDATMFSPLTEDAIEGEAEGETIASTREDTGVPRKKRTAVIYMDGASKHAEELKAFFGNNGRSIQRLQYHNSKTFKEAMNTDCSRMIVLIEEQFSELLEDEYKICKGVLKDLVEAEKDVRLISYLDDGEKDREVKYKLPEAMRKSVVHHTQIRKSANGYVTFEDHPTTATQVGNNNHIEVKPEADSIEAFQVGRSNTFSTSSDHPTTATQVGNNNHIEVKPEADSIEAFQVGRSNTFSTSSDHPTTATQVGNNNHIEVKPGADSIEAFQVGRSNTFSTSSVHPTTATQVGNNNHIEVKPGADSVDTLQVGGSNTLSTIIGPSIQGYKLTITIPDADHKMYAEIKKDIDIKIDDINISLKPLNTWVESTTLGSVIISVRVEPGTKLGPVWLREVITKILSEDIFAKLPNGTRMGINISASVPLIPLDVDIFEVKDEKWITDYTSDSTRKDKAGRSMLHQAAMLGNMSAVILSLKSGCIIDDQDRDGNTALHYAAVSEENSAAVSRLLIEEGASIGIVNRDGYTPLHRAVGKKNLEILELIAERFGVKESNPTSNNPTDDISHITELMVRHGADVNALNKNNLTPLQVAASSQRFDVIAVLLTEGADANVANKNGETPLHCVFGSNQQTGTFTFTFTYRQHEAPRRRHYFLPCVDTDETGEAASSVFDIANSGGITPLHSALRANFLQGVITLMKAGASVNTRNEVMDTPLHTIAGNTSIENTKSENDAVIKLIEYSRDVNVKDRNGNTPLMMAVRMNKDISPLLKAGADVNAQDNIGNTPLIMAVTAGHDISPLLTAGADANSKNTSGQTVLHLVSKDFYPSHIRAQSDYFDHYDNDGRNNYTSQLIAAGADVNARDKNGNTPLMMAVTAGHDISPLLTAGADVNSKNTSGQTALHLIRRYTEGRNNYILQLIAAGADVNARDNNGNTPLIMAVTEGHDISPLLTAGADVNSKNTSGQTALHLIRRYTEGRNNYILQLIAAGAEVNAQDNNGNTPLIMAVTEGHDISPLLTAGADVNSKNTSGQTVLHLVSKDFYPSHMRAQADYFSHYDNDGRNNYTSQLIAAGADVNVRDKNGNTPLMMAVTAGHDISPLLTAGADVNSKNTSGQTALHLIRWHTEGRNNCILLLIAAGADINAQDIDGNTPLHVFVQNHNYDGAMALLLNPLTAVNIANTQGQSVLSLAIDTDEMSPPAEHGPGIRGLSATYTGTREHTQYPAQSRKTTMIRAILNKNPDFSTMYKRDGIPLKTSEASKVRVPFTNTGSLSKGRSKVRLYYSSSERIEKTMPRESPIIYNDDVL